MKKMTFLLAVLMISIMNTNAQTIFGDENALAEVDTMPTSIHMRDMNGDGKNDMIISINRNHEFGWYPNQGESGFGSLKGIDSGLINSLSIADLDGDNDLDVIACSSDKLSWYENTDGAGNFGSRQLIKQDIKYKNVDAADLDGDGDQDVIAITGTSYDKSIIWYENTDGQGSFGTGQFISNLSGRTFMLSISDLDGDEDPDILTDNNGLVWLENSDGAANFTEHHISGSSVSSLDVADLDGDGDMDVLLPYSSRVTWFENTNGQGDFGDSTNITNSILQSVRSVYAGDLDNDTDMDILVAFRGFIGMFEKKQKIGWFENTDGQGDFGNINLLSHQFGKHEDPYFAYAADLNEGNDLDVLSAYEDGRCKIVWFENSPTLRIINHPESNTICVHADTAFKVNTKYAMQYQWQVDNGNGYANLSNNMTYTGIDTSILQISGATADMSGHQYRCIVSNNNSKDTTNGAGLQVVAISANASPDDSICPGNSTILEVTANSSHPGLSEPFTFEWRPSAGLNDTTIFNPTASPVKNTQYKVTVTDGIGCQTTDSVDVLVQEVYSGENICLVTADMELGKSLIIWEKTPNKGTKGYYIHRERKIGGYEKIAYVPYDSLSVYIDQTSEPEQRRHRYKLSAVDTCGNESDPGNYHSPLFLQFVNGQLEWQPYEIEGKNNINFDYFVIYRGSDSTELSPLDTVAGTQSVYNDTDPKANTNKYYYRIAGVKSSPCIPKHKKLKALEGPYNKSISNLEENNTQAQSTYTKINNRFNGIIYPNPTDGKLYIESMDKDIQKIRVSNTVGKTLLEFTDIAQNLVIDLSHFDNGIYIINIITDQEHCSKKIIKQ